MELLVDPFMQSSIADKVVRYHVGIAHPDRVRARVRRSLGLRIGTTFKRGSGTKSIVASIALPLLVAQADRREALALRLTARLRELGVETVLKHDPTSESEKWRIGVARRFTSWLKKWAEEDAAVSVEEGVVVRMDGPRALIAVGDPGLDSFRLERVPAYGLQAAGFEQGAMPFVRVELSQVDRIPRELYLPAWDLQQTPSPAIFELLARVSPAEPLQKDPDLFTPLQ